jgi:hypothetical protein
MITVYNAQNYAQQWFFEKAFASLAAIGKLTAKEIELGRFTSLDGYFAHMGDLISINPSFALIPSDEQPCVINANERTITLPKTFATCGGVVGDTMCEIVTFVIDRYFDYVDLATTNICIQWSTPDKKEGISHISLIDLDTDPGKIRFGWPLTSELTAAAGNIEFSVRCFAEKKDTKEMVYIFNTIPAKLPIKASLNVKGGTVESNVAGLFETFVENSLNPSFSTPAPVTFTSGDLVKQEKIDENDQLVLASYADVADNGHIQYVWYFKEGATPEKADDVPAIQIKGTEDSRYEQKEVYEEIVPMPTKREGNTQYFVKVKEGEADKYTLWVEKELPEQTYYRRLTVLRLKTKNEIGDVELSKTVTGIYWVGATNYTGSDVINNTITLDNGETVTVAIPGYNKTPEVSSTRCYIPLPADITIENLPVDKFIKDGTAKLEMIVNEDGGNPNRSYSWYTSSTKAEVTNSDTLVEAITKAIDVTTPGWYRGYVESELNRTIKTGVSSVCRVLAPITAPELGLSYEQNGSIVNYETTGEDIGIVQTAGEDIKLIITPSFNASNRLLSDELTYTWYVTEADRSRREIVASDIGEYGFIAPANGSDINSNTLVVQKLSNTALAFDCEVTNTLASETSIATQIVPFIVK